MFWLQLRSLSPHWKFFVLFSQFLGIYFLQPKPHPNSRQFPNSRKNSSRKFFGALWTHLTHIVFKTQILLSFVNLFIGQEQHVQKQISFHNFLILKTSRFVTLLCFRFYFLAFPLCKGHHPTFIPFRLISISSETRKNIVLVSSWPTYTKFEKLEHVLFWLSQLKQMYQITTILCTVNFV